MPPAEYICPKCRNGIHNLCSKDWCDCKHTDQSLGTIVPDEGRSAP